MTVVNYESEIDRPDGCAGVKLRDGESGFSTRETQHVVFFCGDGEDG